MAASKENQKLCTSCGGSGPFGSSKYNKDGLKSHCKKCCAEKQAAYRAVRPEVWSNWATENAGHLKARDAARYASDPEAVKARVRAWQEKNPDRVRANASRAKLKKYGLTPQQMQDLLAKQQGLCPICAAPLKEGRAGLQIDHDHQTGEVRGLLCWNCNVMLGDFQEDTARMESAAEYLSGGLVTGLPAQTRPPEAAKQGTRASNLWYKYGLTEVTFQLLLERQGHACAICLNSLNPGPGTHIDHDHSLGHSRGVRGLLCRSCNLGVGHAREGVHILWGAVAYLRARQNTAP